MRTSCKQKPFVGKILVSVQNMQDLEKNEYKQWVTEISSKFRQCQIRAAVKVNDEMLKFYWSLGKDIVMLSEKNQYGSDFYKKLSADLQKELPDVKSFSVTNLYYMRNFYKTYSFIENQENINFPQVGGIFDYIFNIPWGHHKLIIDKCKEDTNKALFFIKKTIENNWSRAVLLNFLDTNLYDREGKAISNFTSTLPATQSDLAQQITKDPYNFDFLTLRETYDEKELKDALMDSITKFLLELGNGFAFVGREVRIEVGEVEKFIDMLFYNIKLHCYVVLEVKVTKFDSAYAGQLGTYVAAVNHQLRGVQDNPTIGILVCKAMDKVEAQYALESSSQPIGISGYELSKLIPEDFKGSLPTIEEIEEKLNNDIQ